MRRASARWTLPSLLLLALVACGQERGSASPARSPVPEPPSPIASTTGSPAAPSAPALPSAPSSPPALAADTAAASPRHALVSRTDEVHDYEVYQVFTHAYRRSIEGEIAIHAAPGGGRFRITTRPGVSAARAQELAAALSLRVRDLTDDTAEQLRVALVQTSSFANVRDPMTPEATVGVLRPGTIVVAIYGRIRRYEGLPPEHESTDAPDGTTYVHTGHGAGLVAARLLRPYAGCLPDLAALAPRDPEWSPQVVETERSDADGGGRAFIVNASWAGIFRVDEDRGHSCTVVPGPVRVGGRGGARTLFPYSACQSLVVDTTPPLFAVEWSPPWAGCDGLPDYTSNQSIERTWRVYQRDGADVLLELTLASHPALGPRRRVTVRWMEEETVDGTTTTFPLVVRRPGGRIDRWVLHDGALVPFMPAAPELAPATAAPAVQ